MTDIDSALAPEPQAVTWDVSVSVAQSGVLVCQWTDDTKDVSPEFFVTVIPDAGASLRTDQIAAYACADDACFRASRYTDSALVTYFSEVPATTAEVDAILTSASAAVDATTPTPREPANDTWQWGSLADCAVVEDAAQISAAFHSPEFTVGRSDSGLDVPPLIVARDRGGILRCTWANAEPVPAGQLSMVTGNIVPGGAWAWDDLTNRAATEDDPRISEPVTVPGADAAVYRCSDDSCEIDVSSGGSVASLYLSKSVDMRELLLAAATALVAVP
ncbi:hypothetical protein [Leifsonia sp. Leaf264]|uniref:hypothetical protein n=1 Tax=Leifsonia sp. Leaf264 TaxID=1736314 RepID=UPI0012FCF93F|nr:hypothetical protein [Leifsonia sp. Leaf264]